LGAPERVKVMEDLGDRGHGDQPPSTEQDPCHHQQASRTNLLNLQRIFVDGH
jgi:hypothetical protein